MNTIEQNSIVRKILYGNNSNNRPDCTVGQKLYTSF